MSNRRASGEGWGHCPWGLPPEGRPPPSCRQNERRFWKHYLPTTSLADGNEKIFPVGCVPPACQPDVLRWPPAVTVLVGVPCLMPKVEGLYSEVQCIMGNGHMGTPLLRVRMTDMTSLQLRWWAVIIMCFMSWWFSGSVVCAVAVQEEWDGESKRECVCLFPLEMNNWIAELFEKEPIKNYQLDKCSFKLRNNALNLV